MDRLIGIGIVIIQGNPYHFVSAKKKGSLKPVAHGAIFGTQNQPAAPHCRRQRGALGP